MIKTQTSLLILALLILSGCSSIPRDSPAFLKDNASLIHTRVETLATAIETSSNSAKKSLDSVQYIKEVLASDQIDKNIIRTQLQIIEQTLSSTAKLGTLPAKAREDASFVVGNLETMSGILQQQVDFTSLVKDLRTKVEALNKESAK